MAELSDYPPIMTAVQAAEFLSVHPEYLRQMVRDERVHAHKIPGGRGWRFLRDELVDWIREQPGAKAKSTSKK
jgi:excisionase family DNA binding protein